MRDLIKGPVKTLFIGTDWESVETFRSLLEDKRFEIVGVITQPDKPVGRKQVMTPSKVKEFAVENGIEVYHTEKQKERYQEALDLFDPELVVCKAFGEIIPEFFLEYPKYKSINVHFSILPKYRGAVPIQKAILDGEKETGISIMLMTAGLDEGDMLQVFKEPILDSDTNLSLRERLVSKSAKVLGDVLERWINEEITPEKQDNDKATYCWQKDISKEKAEIRWNDMQPEYIERMVRAMIPWPVAWTMHEGKRVKIFEASLIEYETERQPGELFIDNNKLLFSTNNENKCIQVHELQVEGKQRVTDKVYLNGIK